MAEKHFDLDPFLTDPHHKHPTMELSFRNQDSITWHAKKAFTITKIEPRKENPDAPHPFLFRPDEELESADGADGIWRVNSGPPRQEAIGKGYEAKFKHGTRKSPAAQAAEGDPDVDITP